MIERVSVPGCPWEMIPAGWYTENYLDEAGHYLAVTVGDDHRIVKRERCDAKNQELIGAGVYQEQYLDRGGYRTLIAIGADHRVLERVRLFDGDDEGRYARQLRQRHGLYDPRKSDRRCRVCRGWFFVEQQSRRVRCQRCIDASKRKDGAA